MIDRSQAINSHERSLNLRFQYKSHFGVDASQPDQVEFIIVHEFADSPEGCAPGEEAALAAMGFRGNWYWVPFGPTHMVTFDFLARRRIPLDAWSIVNKMASDPFVLQHGANAPCNLPRPARLSPAGLRQQVRRMREMLAHLIQQEGLDLDPWNIICSVKSSTCAVRYWINAKVTWVHWWGAEGEDSGACILLSPPRVKADHLL